MQPLIVSFGGTDRERLQIEVLNYERRLTGAYHDDNWVTVSVSISAGGFQGKTDAAFLTLDFISFLSQLRPLYKTLRGEAEFHTMEGQLGLKLVGDGKGHIEFTGELVDSFGVCNRLCFTLQLDQSRLKESIHQLEQMVSTFPERKPKS